MTEWMLNPRRREIATGRAWSDLREQATRMRSQPTAAEDRLWRALRNRQLAGLKFRRQHAIGRFIADFYCVRAALIIKADGPIHHQQQDADRERQAFLEATGLSILRFTNDDVMNHLDQVLSTIRAFVAATIESPSPQEGEGVGG